MARPMISVGLFFATAVGLVISVLANLHIQGSEKSIRWLSPPPDYEGSFDGERTADETADFEHDDSRHQHPFEGKVGVGLAPKLGKG